MGHGGKIRVIRRFDAYLHVINRDWYGSLTIRIQILIISINYKLLIKDIIKI